MSKLIVHLCSETPAIFMINGKQVGFVENIFQSVDISISDISEFLLYIYPIIETNEDDVPISFSAKIDIKSNKLFSFNPNICITDYGKNHFKIEVIAIKIPSITQNITPFYQKIDEFAFSVIKNTFTAQTNSEHFNYALPYKVTPQNIKKVGNFLVFNAKTAKNQDYLLVLNKNLQLCFDGVADKIEFDGANVITLQNIKDIAQHGLVTTYKFNNYSFTKDEQYSVYTQTEPISPANNKAIAWAFMEAVNIQNFALARSYLHPNLSQSLKDEHIIAFFGDFLEVTQSFEDNEQILSLVYAGNPRFVKNYKFELVENRIFNIDTIE